MKEEFHIVNRRPAPGATPRPMQMIVCSVCRDDDFISAHNGRTPAATVAAKFRKAGWVVGDVGEHLCPGCAAKRRVKVHLGGSAMLKSTTTPALDDVARRAIPLLYVALEDKYDRAAKAYRGGASDETIAAELGLPVAVVAERRAADFGPLVESDAARRQREAAAAIASAQRLLRAECDKFEQAQRNAQAAAQAVIAAAERYGAAWNAALVAAQQGRAA
jgi:hypothetical protein